MPAADIVAIATDNRTLRFGLAVYGSLGRATYPAISGDGGATWRVDGPLMHVDALQAASVVTDLGPLPPRGAYFWGHGGNVVSVTTDRGRHWWETGFSFGVYSVSARHGTLRTVALGNQLQGGRFQAFLYVSNDEGRTWKFQAQLPSVK